MQLCTKICQLKFAMVSVMYFLNKDYKCTEYLIASKLIETIDKKIDDMDNCMVERIDDDC